MPSVSVVIPTFNREHYIGRALESVLNQTYTDYEIIIVDDGSTDKTGEIIRRYQETADNIRYIRTTENKGASAARNTGIQEACGTYIAFQDSDDVWMPEKLEKQVKILSETGPAVGLVYTGFWLVKGDTQQYIPHPSYKKREGYIANEILKGSFIGTPTILIKKECFEHMGLFDESLPQLQDWELMIRVSERYQFRFIDEPLLLAHHQGNNISVDQASNIRAREMIFAKHFKKYEGGGRRILAREYFSLGNLYCKNNRAYRGRKYFFRAIRTYPLNPVYFMLAWISMTGSKPYTTLLRMKNAIVRGGVPH
jgi:glycosyltransferase involved in cell wall biosynthesis